MGGYGRTGKLIAQLILSETKSNVIIGGRSPTRARNVVNELNSQFPGERIRSVYADTDEPESLTGAFRGIDMVIACSSSSNRAGLIARYALASNSDYFDIYFPASVPCVLKSIIGEIEQKERCFITQGGIHPGISAPMVRYAAARYNQLSKALIAMAFSEREIGTRESVKELLNEMKNLRYTYWENGRWVNASYRDSRKIDFGQEWGSRLCIPMELTELSQIPTELNLEECGFWVGGFNWFCDNIVFPLSIVFSKTKPSWKRTLIPNLFLWGERRFSKQPFGVIVRLEAEALSGKKPVKYILSIEHSDSFMATAISVVGALLQYDDGTSRRNGLHLMGNWVEPKRFMADIGRMGITIREEEVN